MIHQDTSAPPCAWRRIFATDAAFESPIATYPLPARWEMLRHLGYDGACYMLWDARNRDELGGLHTVAESVGIEWARTWVWMTLNDSRLPRNDEAIRQALESLPPGHTLELTIGSSLEASPKSDPVGDSGVLGVLQRLLEVADRRDLRILLYPHVSCWMERHEDAIRLCGQLLHPRLGLVFTAYHWFALERMGLPALLATAAPFLQSVNLCGSRRVPNALPTVEPLDQGTLDNFAILSSLERMNYRGPIGVQGYSVGGDAYSNLRRSLVALRDMEDRLARHPQWGAVAFK